MSTNDLAMGCVMFCGIFVAMGLVFAIMFAAEEYPKVAIPTVAATMLVGFVWGVWYLNTDHSPRQPKATPMTQPIQPEQ